MYIQIKNKNSVYSERHNTLHTRHPSNQIKHIHSVPLLLLSVHRTIRIATSNNQYTIFLLISRAFYSVTIANTFKCCTLVINVKQ